MHAEGMTSSRIAIVVASAVLLLGVAVQPAAAQPDFTRTQRKQCGFCHVGAWTSGKLTEAGTFFNQKHTLKGFTPKAEPSHVIAPAAAKR